MTKRKYEDAKQERKVVFLAVKGKIVFLQKYEVFERKRKRESENQEEMEQGKEL